MTITPLDATSNTAAATSPAPSSTLTNPLANQNVFLQLLVAQLKNQDPTQPADGTAFITQLAQFSELSNTTQMASDIAAIKVAVTAPPATTTTKTTTT
jgi:flagellar basal-body rod modification protein FlgD